MRRLNRKRKVPTERSTSVKIPRVKDEKVAAESLLLLSVVSEPSEELKMNTDDLLVAHALCSLGDISSANPLSNEDRKPECSVESDYMGRESERQELKIVPVQDQKKRKCTKGNVDKQA